MPPSWDDLRIFLSLAREGTLTTAAKALGVSHPTVARRVQALEKQIGARLFERLPDRFVPTAAGEELLADTEAMEKAALSINRRSAGLSDVGWSAAGDASTASASLVSARPTRKPLERSVCAKPASRRRIGAASCPSSGGGAPGPSST